MPPQATPPVRLVSLFRPATPEDDDLKPAVRVVETPNECLVVEICVDDYLWAFYERTPKVDTNKVKARAKATVTKKGKTRTVTKTITKYISRGLHLEGSDRGAKSRHVAQGLCHWGHGSPLQAEALPRASRNGRRRAHAGHHQCIPRRLPAGDRKRQQGRERQLISWRQPPRRLRPRARDRSGQRQGRNPLCSASPRP